MRLILRKLFLILPLLLILGLAGCDNDNNSNAQDMGDDPGAMDEECPCFTLSDVLSLRDGATGVECINMIFGVELVSDGTTFGQFSIACNADGSGCTCLNTADNFICISQQQYGMCMSLILNAISMFNENGMIFGGCTLIGTE